MKTLLTQFVAPLAFLAFASLPLRAQVLSGNDYVRIEARVETDQDRKDLAKTTADTVTQHKTLHIALSGKAKSPETRRGKWTTYGRNLKNHDITALASGEFKVDLSNGSQKIESKKVSTTYTPEHAEISTSRSRGSSSSRSIAKKIPAEGTKYAGYSIVVKDGDKVVGESADPMGIAKETNK